MDLKGQKVIVLIAALLLALPMLSFTGDEVSAGRPIFQEAIEVLEGYAITTQVQKPVDIQVAPSGRIIILYESSASFSWDVFLVYSDDGGKTWSDPVRVDDVLIDGNSSNDDTHQTHPQMVIGQDNSVYVVWEDWRNWIDDVFTRPIDIRFARSDNGSSFGPSSTITPLKDINTWHAYNPDIAINSDGDLFCVWEDKLDAGAWKNIWSSYSKDDGDTWTTPIMINNDGKDYRNHHNPRCAMDGDHVYVTWHDGRNSTMGPKPFIAISDDGGATFQPEFPLSTDTQVGSHRENPIPVVDDSGNLYVTWMDDRTEVNEVFFTSSADNGGTFTQDRRLFVVPDGQNDHYPHITAKGDGHVAIVWERQVPYAQRFEYDVFYINSSDGGQTWDPILKVDHHDRFQKDRSDQRDIVVTYDGNGRALTSYSSNWNENGVVGSSDFNVWFTRHSVSLSQINHIPELLAPDFQGEYEFDHVVGNVTTLYNFTMTYKDEDNDAPAQGFPRVQIFRDAEGGDPFYPEWTVMEKVLGPSDHYYMDGVDYFVNLNVTEQGKYYWGMQIRDEVDPRLISSDIFDGPLIDTTPPTLEITSPEEATWYGTSVVEVRAIVRDTGGAGVYNRSIAFEKSFHGTGSFENQVRAQGYRMIDNDTVEAWANISLASGTENYVRFIAKDRVGNGFTRSEPINIWLDPDAPYAVNPQPRGDYVNIYGDVNCSIIWRDTNPGSTLVNYTGLDPASFMYAFRTTSGEYSEWMEPDGMMPHGNESYIVWVNETFPDEGVYNFIKWRASDNVGNVMETQGFRITVDIPENYAPVFIGKGYPSVISSPTPHIWWDDAFDEEDDPLYYKVQLLKYPTELQLTGWYELGERTYFDIPDDEALEPNHFILRISVTDDLGGTDVMDHEFQIIDTGTPPPEMVPRFSTFNTSNPNSSISWAPSPDDDVDVRYMIRIGTKEYQGDVLDWTDLGRTTEFSLDGLELGIGLYSIQIMVEDNGNFSRVTVGQLKINDYNLTTGHPATHTAYKGEKGIKITTPIKCQITNMATFSDRVRVVLQGEMVDENWAYLSDSETSEHFYLVNSSKGLTTKEPIEFRITVAAPDTAKRGDYILTYRLVSEDGTTTFRSGEILVSINNAPDDGTGESFADDISGVITDVLPFLEGLPTFGVILIFFILLIVIVGGIIFLGIFISKKRQEKKKKDPLAEQKRVYKEIYGREPTPEELDLMKQQTDKESVDEFIKEGEDHPTPPQEGARPPGKEDELEVSEPPIEGEKEVDGEPEPARSGDKETDDLLDRLFD